jgi:hypothetical protein
LFGGFHFLAHSCNEGIQLGIRFIQAQLVLQKILFYSFEIRRVSALLNTS